MSDLWVIDASVLIQIYVLDEDEQFTDIAKTIVRHHVNDDIELCAPEFLLYEIPSSIHRAVKRRRLRPQDARLAIRHFFNLDLSVVGSRDRLPDLIQSAYERSTQIGCHPYDALYVVVAEATDAPLITADRKLYTQIRHEVDQIVWVADFDARASG